MSADTPLKVAVIESLPWLCEDFGFRVVEDHFDALSFGNSFVTLESSGLRVRFVRDRGQIYAEVASRPEPHTWWALQDVCELLAGHNVEIGSDLPTIADSFRNNLPALCECFGPRLSQTTRDLQKRAEARRHAFSQLPSRSFQDRDHPRGSSC